MSKKSVATIICPYCNKKLDINIWESVNVDLNPEEKEKIFGGHFFDFTCKHCRKIIHGLFSCLYHDMTHRFMIYLVGNEQEAKKTIEMYRDLSVSYDRYINEYQIRVTTDPNVWREKAVIFDRGYDDRIIEILKLLYLCQLEEQHPDLQIERMYFCSEKNNDGIILEFYCTENKNVTAEVSDEVYRLIENKYRSRIQQNMDNQFCVDTEWALGIMKNEK